MQASWKHAGLVHALFLLGLTFSVSVAPAAAPPPAIAVLTPGVPPTLYVTSLELLANVTGISASAGRQASTALTSYARRDGFDAAERFSNQMVGALRAAGRDAVAVKVSRVNRDTPRPLERGELPAVADGRLMLDVTFHYVAIAATSEVSAYKPAIGLSYRVVNASGQIVQGSRTLAYREASAKGLPGWFAKPGSFDSMPSLKSEKLVEFNNDPACSWKTFNQVKESVPHVWVCFDDAFVRLAEGVIAGLP